MDRAPRFDAQHWRDQATETRAKASMIEDPIEKTMLIAMADKYEHMAARASRKESAQSSCGTTSAQ